MATNYVEIKIKASDTAKPDLTDLKLKLDELGAKTETAKVDVDDKDAAVKLLRLNAKLAELNRKVANPRLKVDGAARAEAEILAVEHELDKLDKKAKDAGPGGLLGKIISGVGGANLPGGLPGIGGLPLPALAAVIPAVAALLVEVTGLVSGFAAAGAGAGAFALLAEPSVKKVETAYTALSAAQQKYQAAQAKEAADPTKANATALKTAALNLQLAREAIDKMPASERDAIAGIHGLASEYSKMAAAFAPDVFKVFSSGLALVKTLLPDVLPFARTFADVLDRLLGQAGKFASSKGFGDFLKQFHSIEGPALNSIGEGIGKVAVQVGKLLTTMSGKDVAHSINIAFDSIAATIGALTATVKFLMQFWDGAVIAFTTGGHAIAAEFDRTRHNFADTAHSWAQDFDRVRHDVADLAHNIAAHFDEIRADLHRWADDTGNVVAKVVAWYRALPGRILSVLSSLPGQLYSFGQRVVEGFVRGIESMMGSIVSAAEHMISSLGGKVLKLLGIGSPSKVAHWWGQMIAQGLADGIREHAGLPADAAARMAAGVSAGLRGAAGSGYGYGPGGGGQAVIQIHPAAGGSGLEAQFWSWLKNGVRAQGGDPRMFTKKVQFL